MTVEIKPFFICVGVLLFTELVASVILSMDMIPRMLVIGAIRLLQIHLFLLIFIVWGNGLSSLGLGKNQLCSGLWRGMLWSAAFGIVVFIGLGILFFYGQSPSTLIHTRFPEQTGELLLFLFVGGFVAPVAEEIFFRGMLYGFLRPLGIFVALFLSTLIFVLLHSVRSPTQAVGGVLFAVAYETEGKLMVPITIHVLGNMAIFAVSALF
ncbi:Metalloprotease domain-containing protein [Desulfonema magnum]|uniref:Metalloprotease domain-containing protein n=2 Tax=Desulfonema magnum TaxID=45655 RepID=A0A975BSC0_9BACT|nr:Metalloprotease domain-containing protein [Desulfonema magnum]